MLAGTLLLIASFAQPQIAVQAFDHGPDSVVVEGRVELSPSEADASARDRAGQEARWQLERRAAAVLDARSPFWLPEIVGERIVDEWIRGVKLERTYQVLDVERERHDHGTYTSYRTRLEVAAEVRTVERMLGSLGHRIREGGRRFAWLLGGTAGLWAFLALLYGWVDRLTRGYMPWRLRFVCVGMALAGPGIALLFV